MNYVIWDDDDAQWTDYETMGDVREHIAKAVKPNTIEIYKLQETIEIEEE